MSANVVYASDEIEAKCHAFASKYIEYRAWITELDFSEEGLLDFAQIKREFSEYGEIESDFSDGTSLDAFKIIKELQLFENGIVEVSDYAVASCWADDVESVSEIVFKIVSLDVNYTRLSIYFTPSGVMDSISQEHKSFNNLIDAGKNYIPISEE